MEIQQTFQFDNGGSIPTTPHSFKIYKGVYKDFSHLLKKYHYKSDKIGGGISHHLTLKYGLFIVGGCVIGQMRHRDKYDVQSVELRRMVLHPDCPKNTASYFLSKIIWWLKNNTYINTVFTFADQSVGHIGTCYKASNFEFVKKTSPSNHILWNDKLYHMRSLTIDRPYSYKIRENLKTGKAKIIKGKPKLLYKYEIKRKKN